MTTLTENQDFNTSLEINGKRHNYTVSIDYDQGLLKDSWDLALSFMTIRNSHGDEVYTQRNHGNRIALLINCLHIIKRTVYVTHNGTQYVYVPSMDVLVSRKTKKVCFADKSNPQRQAIIKKAVVG